MGSVAVGGSGKISMAGMSRIEGNLSYKTNGTLTKAATATITGSTFQNSNTDSLLNAGSSAALQASSFLDGFSASSGYPTTINSNTSLSLTTSGVAVLKLTDFKLSNNATLTLNGTASSFFVINVKKGFSLDNANVVLSGGLTWDHVLVNIRGGGSAAMKGNSEFNGIILAPDRDFEMSGSSRIVGALVANKLKMSGNSSIRCPNVSP